MIYSQLKLNVTATINELYTYPLAEIIQEFIIPVILRLTSTNFMRNSPTTGNI